jgi:hypothetical protein
MPGSWVPVGTRPEPNAWFQLVPLSVRLQSFTSLSRAARGLFSAFLDDCASPSHTERIVIRSGVLQDHLRRQDVGLLDLGRGLRNPLFIK